MKDLSLNVFMYAGKKYTFAAILSDADNTFQYPIDNNDIELFEYSNQFNQLYLTGKLVATDHYGKFDRLLQMQYVFCYVTFVEHEQKFDGNVTIEKLSEERAFYCRFYIDNILVLGRQGPNIKYEFHLVSENIFRCLANIDYTNQDKEPEPIFDILKACMSQVECPVDIENFSKITSPVKINYSTTCNDNLLTVTKYLMNKQYYYQTKDISLKLLWYNETKLTYNIFDVSNKYEKSGVYTVIISPLNSNNEGLVEREPTLIGSVILFPSLKNVMNLKTHNMYEYKFDENKFNNDCKIETKEAVTYVNKTLVGDNTITDRASDVTIKNLVFEDTGSYWNNNLAVYDNAVKNLIENNCLVLNTSGDILRKPSSYTQVMIDRDTRYTSSFDDKKSYEDKLSRYQGLEGTWFATRVSHIIEPSLAKFRQNVVLSRNFLPKFK